MENVKEFKGITELSDEEIERVAGGDGNSVNKDNCGRDWPSGRSRKCIMYCTSKSPYDFTHFWCPRHNIECLIQQGLPESAYTD